MLLVEARQEDVSQMLRKWAKEGFRARWTHTRAMEMLERRVAMKMFEWSLREARKVVGVCQRSGQEEHPVIDQIISWIIRQLGAQFCTTS